MCVRVTVCMCDSVCVCVRLCSCICSPELLPSSQCDGAEVRLDDRDATLFYYIHKLCQRKNKSEPLKRAWDLLYSLVYQEGEGGAEELPQVGMAAVGSGWGVVMKSGEGERERRGREKWGKEREKAKWKESLTAYAALLHIFARYVSH